MMIMSTPSQRKPVTKPSLDPFTNFGMVTHYRLMSTVASIAEKTQAQRLEPLRLVGDCAIMVSGQNTAVMDFLGIRKGKMLYQSGKKDVIERKLRKVSSGWRYDIFVSEIMSREEIRSHIASGRLDPAINVIQCSHNHAFELAVLDKKTGKWLPPVWFSIGTNQDSLLTGRTAQDRFATPVVARGTVPEVHSTIREDLPDPVHAPDQNGPTRLRLGIEELKNRLIDHLASTYHFDITFITPIFSSSPTTFQLDRNTVDAFRCSYSLESGVIHLSWSSDGKTNYQKDVDTRTFDPKYRKPIGNDYTVSTNAFSLNSPHGDRKTSFLIASVVYDDIGNPYGYFVATSK